MRDQRAEQDLHDEQPDHDQDQRQDEPLQDPETLHIHGAAVRHLTG